MHNAHTVSTRVDEEVYKKLETLKTNLGKNISEIIRDIVTDYFVQDRHTTIENITEQLGRIIPDLKGHQKAFLNLGLFDLIVQ